MNADDSYTVLTPFGVVRATFPDDVGIVLDGSPDAVAAVRREIVGSVGPIGITLDPESLAEEDFEAFCQGPGKLIRIVPPLRPPAPDPVAPEAVDGAVATLEVALDVLKTNEPINRAEGNMEQANLEARNAADIERALKLLRMDSAISAQELREAILKGTGGAAARLVLAKSLQAERTRVAEATARAPEVARTILQQLGGKRFQVMTGAKNALSLGPSSGAPYGGLQFALPKGFSQLNGKSTGINRVIIKLNSSDTYDIEFGNARGTSYKVVNTAEGIYADSLREVFTRYTGLDTSLGTAGPGGGPGRDEVLAEQLGRRWREAGKTAVPAFDMEFDKLLKGITSERARDLAFAAWNRGWKSGRSEPTITAERVSGDMNNYGGFALIVNGERKVFVGEEPEGLADEAAEMAHSTGMHLNEAIANLAVRDGWDKREPMPGPAPVQQPEPRVDPQVASGQAALAGLAAHGWKPDSYGTGPNIKPEFMSLMVGGGHVGGMVNPTGQRRVMARLNGPMLVATHGIDHATGGDKIVGTALVGIGFPEKAAQDLHEAVMRWASLSNAERSKVEGSLRETQALLDKELGYSEDLRKPARIAYYRAHVAHLQDVLAGKAKIGEGPKMTDEQRAGWDDTQAVIDERARQAAEPAGRFRYALVNRPADIGTVPKGLNYTVEPRPARGQPHFDMARHGILVADRELTPEEIKAFELAPLVEGDDLPVLAEQVARGMAEYAQGYLEQAKEDPEVFAMAIRQTIEQSASGIQYSVGDPAALAAMVRDKLAAMVPAEPAVAGGGGATADPARAAALDFLAEVIGGRHPQMLDPELADRIEQVLTEFAADSEIQVQGEKAIIAYSNGLMAATGG